MLCRVAWAHWSIEESVDGMHLVVLISPTSLSLSWVAWLILLHLYNKLLAMVDFVKLALVYKGAGAYRLALPESSWPIMAMLRVAFSLHYKVINDSLVISNAQDPHSILLKSWYMSWKSTLATVRTKQQASCQISLTSNLIIFSTTR